MMKYKEAYGVCMDYMFDEVSPETRADVSEALDEIFGEDRRC